MDKEQREQLDAELGERRMRYEVEYKARKKEIWRGSIKAGVLGGVVSGVIAMIITYFLL